MEKRTYRQIIAQTQEITNENNVQNQQINSQKLMAGGRQLPFSIPLQGGGYLDNYSVLELQPREPIRDPRLDDLKKMGLHKTWQNIAAAIGMDNFLAMWRMLSEDSQFTATNSGRIKADLRNYSSYKRMVRDRYILCLYDAGYSYREITEKITQSLGLQIREDNVVRIVIEKKGLV